jgi:membrane-associated protein
VVTPFLPGDSLLFVAGTLAATGHMDIHTLFAALACASFLGDNTNYWAGRFTGPRIFRSHEARLLNRAHLDRTRIFFERHGGKTVVIARFMPIVRTFAPFVAGIGRMRYAQFLAYSFAGSVLWISFFVYGGYFFGNIPLIRQNLAWFIIGIVLVSVMPGAITWLRSRAAA